MAQHLKPLTSLRFFAAAAIVIFHMSNIFPWSRIGAMSQGVSFFFVLSGFILTYIYGQSLNIRQFYLHRFARLWPIHVVCFMLTIALINLPIFNTPLWPAVATANLMMIHSWIPIYGFPLSFNGPSWSISVELAFYLCFPLLIRTRYFYLTYIGIAVSVVSSLLIVELLTEPSKPSLFSFWNVHFVLQNPLVRILEFATGVAAGKLYLTGKRLSLNGTSLELGVIAILIAYWITIIPVFKTIHPHSSNLAMWYSQSGGLFLFAAAILIFAWGNGVVSSLLSHKTLVLLGKISFSTYMLHHIVIRFYNAHDLGLAWYWSAAIVLTVTYYGSYLLWKYIEEPSRKIIVSYAKNKSKARLFELQGNDYLQKNSNAEELSK